jgi:hypothetical protein
MFLSLARPIHVSLSPELSAELNVKKKKKKQ